MSGFFSAMFEEMVARRRRRRDILGDWGLGFSGFLVLTGLTLGSIGLFIRPWMAAAAPWGFALPLVFVLGFVLIEWRRQAVLARGADAENVASGYDWITLLWAFACALAGAAAFVTAWSHEPPPWTPPPSAIVPGIDLEPP